MYDLINIDFCFSQIIRAIFFPEIYFSILLMQSGQQKQAKQILHYAHEEQDPGVRFQHPITRREWITTRRGNFERFDIELNIAFMQSRYDSQIIRLPYESCTLQLSIDSSLLFVTCLLCAEIWIDFEIQTSEITTTGGEVLNLTPGPGVTLHMLYNV